MTNRIQVCQGCRGSLQVDGKIPPPPHDHCIARLERRHFMDITTGEKRLGNPSNSHYHISKTCFPTSFNFCFLQIEEQIEEEYRNFIKASLS